MRRRAVQILVLLILGAIVNVAVAWGLALTARPYNKSTEPMAGEVAKWVGSNLPAPLEEEIHYFDRFTSFGCELIQAPEVPLITVAPDYLQRKQCGFPLKAMEQSYWAIFEKGIHNAYNTWSISKRKAVPTKLLWRGFAINTIFYAAILWMVFFVSGMVKRTLRCRRGLCPACAYPIGTSPVCTECGGAVRTQQ